jgi:hypothetical protein
MMTISYYAPTCVLRVCTMYIMGTVERDNTTLPYGDANKGITRGGMVVVQESGGKTRTNIEVAAYMVNRVIGNVRIT